MVGASPSPDVALLCDVAAMRRAELGAIADRYMMPIASAEPEVSDAAKDACNREIASVFARAAIDQNLKRGTQIFAAWVSVLASEKKTRDLMLRIGRIAGENCRRFNAPGKGN